MLNCTALKTDCNCLFFVRGVFQLQRATHMEFVLIEIAITTITMKYM